MRSRILTQCAVMALAAVASVLATSTCGGHHRQLSGLPQTDANRPEMAKPAVVSLENALAELEALAAPEGVSAEVFSALKEELKRQLTQRGKMVCTPPPRAVDDLAVVAPATDPPTITWSSHFFIADGNTDGGISIADVTPVAIHFLDDVNAEPAALVADYNRDGIVNISDITPLAINFGQRVESFQVQLAEAEGDDFSPVEMIDWDAAGGPDESGFAVFQYQFAAGDLAGLTEAWCGWFRLMGKRRAKPPCLCSCRWVGTSSRWRACPPTRL